ncbi:hypothetical protein [Streptomyces glaucescens]|uniref:Uncharacterized protein n=1 Tax=Streptomyces glaucescens TaxID=1907 RepID=A0A089XGC7_STRGA|nr:hypothetical protein [Streptomyces glaucescens]AIS00947.1 hypothetical protein SGLAU_25045 [Streptomyces glaucescens]
MRRGANINIIPDWTPQTGQIDFVWDDAKISGPHPEDKWFGRLAFIGGAVSYEGDWDWDPAANKLHLWVPVPGGDGHRHLVAVLDQFALPPTAGMTGPGALAPTLGIPVIGDLTLTWRV